MAAFLTHTVFLQLPFVLGVQKEFVLCSSSSNFASNGSEANIVILIIFVPFYFTSGVICYNCVNNAWDHKYEAAIYLWN